MVELKYFLPLLDEAKGQIKPHSHVVLPPSEHNRFALPDCTFSLI